MLVSFTLNGDPVEVALKTADRLLVDVLREDLRMTGTKHGCGIGACGTCTVIMDGEPIASCLQLAALCEGADVRTDRGSCRNAMRCMPFSRRSSTRRRSSAASARRGT